MPFFAFFRGATRDYPLEPDADLLRTTRNDMVATSKIATLESQREQTTREFLALILQSGVQQIVINRKAIPDHSITHNLTGKKVTGCAPLAIFEEKSEMGTSGDPSSQGEFSYITYWISFDQKAIRDVSFCPSFIVSMAGPYMSVTGAIFTSNVVAQRLTDFVWLGSSRAIDEGRVKEVARNFLALRMALQCLRNWYDSLTNSLTNSAIPSDHRFFPVAMSFKVEDKTVCFRYDVPLKGADPTCIVFRRLRSGGSSKADPTNSQA